MNKDIGTYSESSLHHSLKFSYSAAGQTEVNIGGYVCDGQAETGELIEVQTGSFGPIKEKIKELSKNKKVRLIYPIIIKKYIELYDTDGNLIRKKKSPKKGSIWDLFASLVYAPELCLLPKLTLELTLLDIVEKRINDGKGAWRRKYITIKDKIPLVWHESIIIKEPKDYYLFIPFKDESFTARDLSEKAGISRQLAQKCLYVLHKTGIIERTGKQKNAYKYKIGDISLAAKHRQFVR